MLSHVFGAGDKTSSSFSAHGKIGNFIIISSSERCTAVVGGEDWAVQYHCVPGLTRRCRAIRSVLSATTAATAGLRTHQHHVVVGQLVSDGGLADDTFLSDTTCYVSTGTLNAVQRT